MVRDREGEPPEAIGSEVAISSIGCYLSNGSGKIPKCQRISIGHIRTSEIFLVQIDRNTRIYASLERVGTGIVVEQRVHRWIRDKSIFDRPSDEPQIPKGGPLSFY